MRMSRNVPMLLLLLSAFLWVLPGRSAADDAQQPSQPSLSPPPPQPVKASVSTPLVDVPERVNHASQEEGPLLGVWHVLTDADRAAAPAPPPAPQGKMAKPQPLTLRDYLNAQQQGSPSDRGTLLQYGF